MSIKNANASDRARKKQQKKDMKLKKRRIKKLKKVKVSRIGFLETIVLRFKGNSDGKNNLLRLNQNGEWTSSFIESEKDALEQCTSEQIASLKKEQESLFLHLNSLITKAYQLNSYIVGDKKKFKQLNDISVDTTKRLDCEARLSDTEVAIRRLREKEDIVQPIRDHLIEQKVQLDNTMMSISELMNRIELDFDTTSKFIERLIERSRRRIDIYWKSADRKLSNLPVEPYFSFHKKVENNYIEYIQKSQDKISELKETLKKGENNDAI